MEKKKDVINLLIDDTYNDIANGMDINDIKSQKRYIMTKINDYLDSHIINLKHETNIRNFINIPIPDDNIIYLFLTILNNVLSNQNKNEHFTNFYNNYTTLMINTVDTHLKELKDIIDKKKDELLGLDEYIELYVFDNNNMLTIYNKINV